MKVINGRDDIIKSELRAIKQSLHLPRLNTVYKIGTFHSHDTSEPVISTLVITTKRYN